MKKRLIIEQLKQHDKDYFNGIATMTDTEYDLLKEKAKNQYPLDPYFKTIGASATIDKVDLPYRLGSLDKTNIDNVYKWVKEQGDIVVSYKLDGGSFMVIYENGKVTFAATRGDGNEGQDITEKMKTILPEIRIKDYVALRGELLLVGDEHLKLGYKNRRNGVNGALANSIESLVPVFYEVLDAPDIDDMYEDQRLLYIKDTLELPTVDFFVLYGKGNKNVVDLLVTKLMEAKSTLNYDIDGLVLTKNDSVRENVMIPENKIAFKVNTDAVKVKVTDIEWNVGRTGRIIPTILIEPTELDGVTISRTTGFNYDYIRDNQIGKGSIVGLIRAGSVIPYITEVFESEGYVELEKCPSCGNDKLELNGVDVMCTNKDCYDSKVRQIAHYLKTMGADYITETTIRNLGVSSIEDMYELDELEIAGIEGFGIKKAEQVYYEIQKTLKATPDKLLAAFGISGIGKTLAPVILNRYKFEDLFEVESIENVDGVGEILSPNFVNTINNFKPLYEYLLTKGLTFMKTEKSSISGLVFTLTGKMPMKRDVITRMITAKGGSVKGISKSTNYLVTDDPNSGSAKNKKAQSFGTKIIDFETLMELIEG
jgi:DNA ligase (NAD+)